MIFSHLHRYGGAWIDGSCIRHCEMKLCDNGVVADHPCGWGRAGFGVGSVKGCALVPDSAMNVCGWFGENADESLQKCEQRAAAVAIAGALLHCDWQGSLTKMESGCQLRQGNTRQTVAWNHLPESTTSLLKSVHS